MIKITIKPASKVDRLFLELFRGELTLEVNEHFAKWLTEKLESPFNGDTQRLFSYIFEEGMNEIISKYQFEGDFVR